jgi:hypothetical protein
MFFQKPNKDLNLSSNDVAAKLIKEYEEMQAQKVKDKHLRQAEKQRVKDEKYK